MPSTLDATARALWAGPGARRALAAGGTGTVEFALSPGGYARLGHHWLLLAPPRSPRGPLSILVAGLERAPLAPGDQVALAPGGTLAPRDTLRAGALEIDLARVRGPRLALVPPPLALGWQLALAAALDAAPPAPPDFAAGLAALRRGDLPSAAGELAGRGPGLTPAGDDVLAGYAAWRHAERRPVALDGTRCSPLGLAYLRCADRGELPEPVDTVLRAVRSADAGAARRRSRALSRWGASSGAAMLWGIAAGACA